MSRGTGGTSAGEEEEVEAETDVDDKEEDAMVDPDTVATASVSSK